MFSKQEKFWIFFDSKAVKIEESSSWKTPSAMLSPKIKLKKKIIGGEIWLVLKYVNLILCTQILWYVLQYIFCNKTTYKFSEYLYIVKTHYVY
jgi:hypothetical protein